MAKIFDVQDWLKNHPNRNNFDLTHKVHGSYQMGKLYPVLCKPVVPTDSFRIDTAVSLRFTPMPFPTQSNMRVIFHYFYVRTKNIWKNFPNWLQGLEEHTPPFLDKPAAFYRNGTLADYLGVQTSAHIGFNSNSMDTNLMFGGNLLESDQIYLNDFYIYNPVDIETPILDTKVTGIAYANPSSYDPTYIRLDLVADDGGVLTLNSLDSFGLPLLSTATYSFFNFEDYNSGYVIVAHYVDPHDKVLGYSNFLYDSVLGIYKRNSFVFKDGVVDSHDIFNQPIRVYFYFKCAPVVDTPSSSEPIQSPLYLSAKVPITFSSNGYSYQIGDSGVSCPYYGTNANVTSNSIKVSALPFRAYESIYNAFYRNSQGVQPFQINGVTQYNKYVTTDDDGADSTNYHLFERNWELDAYTSCLISPQQGNVPYVGITDISALGRLHVETPDGHSAEVRLSDNGDGVEISDLRGETPESRAYALRAASSGFTIPEFRETNALQRFLEMNIRKGYKYIDFIEGHFGKKPTYAEMDMPEFIGGFSQRIQVNEVSNTNGVETDTLGAIAGQARAIGGSKHGVNHYFDDFGFVIGIMCIVPDNAYDCLLPKHFNLQQPLDLYFPEFSQLSYMPLTHEELAPLQTINDGRGSSYQSLTKVFGYQRPNHDLVWYPDTVHGLFRDATGIGDSVICRRFGNRPELGNDFLTIKPSETDTIFNYQFGDEDICLGEVVLKISAKRPVPRLVVPTIS